MGCCRSHRSGLQGTAGNHLARRLEFRGSRIAEYDTAARTDRKQRTAGNRHAVFGHQHPVTDPGAAAVRVGGGKRQRACTGLGQSARPGAADQGGRQRHVETVGIDREAPGVNDHRCDRREAAVRLEGARRYVEIRIGDAEIVHTGGRARPTYVGHLHAEGGPREVPRVRIGA